MCPSGQVWDASQGECVEQMLPAQESAAPASGCSQWPGTVPEQDPYTGQIACTCPGSLFWSPVQKQCISTTAASEPAGKPSSSVDCSKRPGTFAQRNALTGEWQCDCAGGTQWDQSRNACVMVYTWPTPPSSSPDLGTPPQEPPKTQLPGPAGSVDSSVAGPAKTEQTPAQDNAPADGREMPALIGSEI
jgi:hypothetical protein